MDFVTYPVLFAPPHTGTWWYLAMGETKKLAFSIYIETIRLGYIKNEHCEYLERNTNSNVFQ